MSIELKDKLYTSTQVADILGVSLRTLYRYMEDGKIQSMRTASGRHRFTKDQILEFLNAGGFGGMGSTNQSEVHNASVVSRQEASVSNVEADNVFTSPAVHESPFIARKPEPEIEEFEDFAPQSPINQQGFKQTTFEPVENKREVKEDMTYRSPFTPNVVNNNANTSQFAKFDDVQRAPLVDNVAIESKKEALDLNDANVRYYKSDYSDLIELARKIKDTAMSKDLEYAFTLFAGLSLHFSIKPFTKLHFYANPEDMQIWKSELRLTPVQNREDANMGVLVNTDIVFVPTKEIGGFKVVEDKVLMRDLSNRNEEDLVKQFRQHLMSA